MLDIYELNPTSVKVPGQPTISTLWKPYLDETACYQEFDVLGVKAVAERNGAGVITYSYEQVGGEMDHYRLLRLLREVNEAMRNQREKNIDPVRDQFEEHAPKPKVGAGAIVVGVVVVAVVVVTAPVWVPAAAAGASFAGAAVAAALVACGVGMACPA